MAVRVPKTGASGGVEFTQGSQPLHISELDGDLDALFNGGITDSNIAIGANIATSKLASDAGITAAMLAANSVTTAKIANLNVTSGKLAINATGPALSSGQLTFTGTVQNTTQTLLTLASMTTRGGRVLLMGTVSGQWIVTSTSSDAAWVIRRDGTAIVTWKHQSIATVAAASGSQLPGHFSPLFVDLAPSAAAHVYSLELTVTGGVSGAIFAVNATNPGFLFAMELA